MKLYLEIYNNSNLKHIITSLFYSCLSLAFHLFFCLFNSSNCMRKCRENKLFNLFSIRCSIFRDNLYQFLDIITRLSMRGIPSHIRYLRSKFLKYKRNEFLKKSISFVDPEFRRIGLSNQTITLSLQYFKQIFWVRQIRLIILRRYKYILQLEDNFRWCTWSRLSK